MPAYFYLSIFGIILGTLLSPPPLFFFFNFYFNLAQAGLELGIPLCQPPEC
jgi:hypothetical protein